MNLKAKDYAFIVIVIIGTILFLYQKFSGKVPEAEDSMRKVTVSIGDAKITADFPGNQQDLYKGLGGREFMGGDEGMLFDMNNSGRHKFVMRDMMFDLDFIFINDGVVVDMARSVSYRYKGEVAGMADYRYVLEVNADWTKKNNINIGDEVTIKER